ncbi:uncharacterized protein K452DRAFT_307595 [Aplosporella prunicola CBS 121167]|uniref:DNA endonuclease activator Ctp1 C-terminal domain-containing protein n=1 Tax=Aplosporella prunicola CBS 121167 TaxID=1176127 RepID=A0A6A6BHK2_9PEZI|nr:uncharacterized protein K452DRAFT_307595 [Aplosporella prunicola CBS 121167]KAF2143476.1 hypothetical protein K452DRAFT_307595 [Aplosporella prunicola CBS 121167]
METPTENMPASPGAPLYTMSPERVNGIRTPYNICTSPQQDVASPKLGSPARSVHSRSGSDHVQGMVARFNSMDVRDPKELHRRDEVAIKRAEMAREMAELDSKKLKEEKDEAESQARRYREEARKSRKDIEEGREREKKVAKRLDAVMEDLHRAKETHVHTQGLYEKEIRKARKEAFKSSSMLVKLQEELKATRNSLRITQAGFESEKMKSNKREQESFQAQCQLISMQEELKKARELVNVVEQERDALKTSLKEEEVARIAAEGQIALPPSDEFDEEFGSPKKSPTKVRTETSSSDKENVEVPAHDMEMKTLNEDLDAERTRRQRAEDTIEFMKMECQFQCCSCRVAELKGDSYVHDDSFEKEMQRIWSSLPTTPPASDGDVEDVKAPAVQLERPATPSAAEKTAEQKEEEALQLTFSPTSGTFRSVPSPMKPKAEAEQLVDSVMAEALEPVKGEEMAVDAPAEAQPAQQQQQPAAPLSPTPSVPDDAPAAANKAAAGDNSTTVGPPSPPRTPPPPPPTQPTHHTTTPAHHDHHHGHGHSSHRPGSSHHDRLIRRTVTTTTTVPMHFDSPKPYAATTTTPAPGTPTSLLPAPRLPSLSVLTPTRTAATAAVTPQHAAAAHVEAASPWGALPIDRAAALEQIRLRRGRARSVAAGLATPRRPVLGEYCSAIGGSAVVGGGGGGVGVGAAGVRSESRVLGRRDLSAPAGWGVR